MNKYVILILFIMLYFKSALPEIFLQFVSRILMIELNGRSDYKEQYIWHGMASYGLLLDEELSFINYSSLFSLYPPYMIWSLDWFYLSDIDQVFLYDLFNHLLLHLLFFCGGDLVNDQLWLGRWLGQIESIWERGAPPPPFFGGD